MPYQNTLAISSIATDLVPLPFDHIANQCGKLTRQARLCKQHRSNHEYPRSPPNESGKKHHPSS